MRDEVGGIPNVSVKPLKGARYIVADVGSNTVRAMAVEVDDAERLVSYADSFIMSALGRGLFSGHQIQQTAIERTAEFIAEFLAEAGPVDDVFAVGTAACRDASNTDVLTSILRERAGVKLHVLSGEEEARLTYLGATADCDISGQTALVADIGGRSTELVCEVNAELQMVSLAIGARSLTERFLHSDPPGAVEIAAASAHIADELNTASAIIGAGDICIAAGGTACTVAFHTSEWQMSAGRLAALREDFCSIDLQQRREALSIDPDRAEVICGGLLILEALAARAPDRSLCFTIGGLREGVLIAATGAAAVIHAVLD